jgi:hypothetical protein
MTTRIIREKALVKDTRAAWEQKEAETAAEAADIISHSEMLSKFSQIKQRWSPESLGLLTSLHADAGRDLQWLISRLSTSVTLHLECMAATNDANTTLAALAEQISEIATFSGAILGGRDTDAPEADPAEPQT